MLANWSGSGAVVSDDDLGPGMVGTQLLEESDARLGRTGPRQFHTSPVSRQTA